MIPALQDTLEQIGQLTSQPKVAGYSLVLQQMPLETILDFMQNSPSVNILYLQDMYSVWFLLLNSSKSFAV